MSVLETYIFSFSGQRRGITYFFFFHTYDTRKTHIVYCAHYYDEYIFISLVHINPDARRLLLGMFLLCTIYLVHTSDYICIYIILGHYLAEVLPKKEKNHTSAMHTKYFLYYITFYKNSGGGSFQQ